MTSEEKFIHVLANSGMALGLLPPTYKRPKWYQFRLKRKLAYFQKVGWPYLLED